MRGDVQHVGHSLLLNARSNKSCIIKCHKKMMRKLIYLLAISAIFACAVSADTLAYVVHMASVGAKYPEKILKGWVGTPGALTPVGMRQLYLLGRQLRQRYVDDLKLLGERYNPRELTFRSAYSTSKTPCTAAYALAAGFYMVGTGYSLTKFQMERAVPPTNFTNYTEYQQELRDASLANYFTSLPIMTLTEEPNYPFEAADLCRTVPRRVSESLDKNDTLRSRMDDREAVFISKLYPAIKRVMGLTEDVKSMDQAMDYRDYIVAAKHYAYPLNGELTAEEKALLDQLYETKKYMHFFGEKTVAQLVSYTVLKEMHKALKGLVKKTSSDAETADNIKDSMREYILPDTNVLAMLRLLNYWPAGRTVTVPFASSLHFEVYKNEAAKYYVKIIYNDDKVMWESTGSDTVPLETFMKWIAGNTLADFKTECMEMEIEPLESYWIKLSLILGGAVLLLLGIVIYLIMTKRRTEEPSTGETAAASVEP